MSLPCKYSVAQGSFTSIADGGSSTSVFAANGHGMEVGDMVTITGASAYEGTYTIAAVGDANHFTINKVFTDTDAGDWEQFTRTTVTWELFRADCPRTNLQCSSTSTAYVPATTICQQRLF